MTTFFLVRHATHALLGRVLVGRTPGVGLDATGRRQAADLAQSLAGQGVTHLQSSPRRRARDTAAPMARALSLPIAIEPALDEIDVGAWSGRSFAALKLDPDWDLWNARRSAARPPGGGETMAELQCRVAGHLAATAARWPHARIVAVTHAEPIRAAILHVGGIALDDFAQIDIAPASITTIAFGATGADVVAINQAVAA